jgi:aldehyde:ferredoxin oxidoreductase
MGFLDEAKLLRVNLTEGDVKEEKIPKKVIEKYIGGKGLGAYYLYKELPEGIDPLSSENKLIFMTGPVTGYVPSTSRYVVITKSPLTGGWLDSYSGGHFPAELRFTGYWGIIFEGQSNEWVALKIDEDEIELEAVPSLKGKDTYKVEEHFQSYKVASIGPAGENLVRFACITNDKGRQAGRGGVGAVMGSKRLKAIAVKADKDKALKEMPEELRKLREFHLKRLPKDEDVAWAKDHGTPVIVEWSNSAGVLPTRNFREGQFEGAKSIDIEAVSNIQQNRKACYLCPVACSRWVKVPDGLFKGVEAEGPEYETISIGGANTGVDNLGAIVAFNDACDRYGMDTISAGVVIGWAMECTEKGIYDFGIRFGDAKGLVDMVKKIAYRESVGDILAEGVKKAAEKVGGTGFAVHVKGMEIPGYDPRGSVGMALAYATADRGGDHLRAWPIAYEAFGDMDPFAIKGKAEIVVKEQNENSALWSLTSCDFVKYNTKYAVEMLNASGFNMTVDEYLIIGERIYNLTRLFNVREGFGIKEDSLPKRFTEPIQSGAAKGHSIKPEDFKKMLLEYYRLRGWDEEGRPLDETIERLRLKEL